MSSWSDDIHAAATPSAKARLHLQRALGRQSKRLIAADIEAALILWEDVRGIETLLAAYGLPYSQHGLHLAAERLLEATK